MSLPSGRMGQVGRVLYIRSDKSKTFYPERITVPVSSATDCPGIAGRWLRLGEERPHLGGLGGGGAGLLHGEMVAYVTGNAEPIYGAAAHAAMVRQMFRIFPDVHVHNDRYPVQFGSGDWITVVARTTGTSAKPEDGSRLESGPRKAWLAPQARTQRLGRAVRDYPFDQPSGRPARSGLRAVHLIRGAWRSLLTSACC